MVVACCMWHGLRSYSSIAGNAALASSLRQCLRTLPVAPKQGGVDEECVSIQILWSNSQRSQSTGLTGSGIAASSCGTGEEEVAGGVAW
jgi:hypothetical protein